MAIAPPPLPAAKPLEERAASFTTEEMRLLDRLAEEKAERERLAREEARLRGEAAEQERLAREEARLAEEKAQQERLALERAEREAAEQERAAREKAEKDRKEKRHRAVVVSLLTFVIVILAALALVYRRRSPKKPTGGVSAPSVNNPQANLNPPSPQRPETLRPVVPGQVRENPRDGLKYVWIPPGTFMMGCSPKDTECWDDEKPSHRIAVSKGFWMGQTEVTVGAYKRFAGASGRQMPPPRFKFNRGWSNDAMPIVNLTWYDARDYCSWAGGG